MPPIQRFASLPSAVVAVVLSFLHQSDAGALLPVSRAFHDATAAGMRTLHLHEWPEPPRDEDAQRTGELQELVLTSVADGLLDAIGDGSVGGGLQRVNFGHVDMVIWPGLVAHLRAGRLPNLSELALGHARSTRAPHFDDLIELVGALEARREMGLPPITRIERFGTSTALFGADVLQRIWACCPPDKATYFEVTSEEQLAALGDHLLSAHFPALRKLVLAGDRHPKHWFHMFAGGTEAEVQQRHPLVNAAGILEALDQGRAPAVKRFVYATGRGRWDR